MKKFFSKTVFAVAAIAAGLSSCSHDTNVYNPDNAFKTQEELYNKAFAEQFGTPAEGHDWGFGNGSSRAAVSRGSNTEANMWGGYIEVPAPLTEQQITVVTNWFATHQNPQGVAVDYKEYFAQQVSSTDRGRNMDQIWDASDHINNFNNGDCGKNGQVWDGTLSNPADQNSKVFHEDKIMLMTNQSTKSFKYHETVSQKWWDDHYVIIPGDVIDPIVAGMYFVGFDYEAAGQDPNQIIPADGYYNDWIIKITPGLYKDAQRVIAEDLGAVGDFDFNDVVFDVRPCSPYNNPYTLITVRAAGGTMPLYIEGKEVHELFGVDTKTMVNTGATSCPVAQFTIDGVKEAKDVKITIDNGEITFNLENGDAPKKICVGADYNWCDERQKISAKYPNYTKYVADPTYKDWYK